MGIIALSKSIVGFIPLASRGVALQPAARTERSSAAAAAAAPPAAAASKRCSTLFSGQVTAGSSTVEHFPEAESR